MTKAEIKLRITELNKTFDGALTSTRKRIKQVENTVIQTVGINDELEALESARAGYTDLLERIGDDVPETPKTDAAKK